MNKTTTQNDLLLYAYNESDMKDSDRIQRAIDGDPLIEEEYREINETLEILDQGKVSPSDSVIKKILEKASQIKG